MKNFVFALYWIAGIGLMPTTTGAEIELKLSNPEQFTDIERSNYSKKRAAAFFEQDLRKLLLSLEKEYLKEGHLLTIDILNVDLAGSVEIGSAIPNQPTRVLRPAERIKIELRFTLKDQDQVTLKSGQITLSDVINTSALSFHNQSRLRGTLVHEAQLIKNWLADLYQQKS